jgi:Concanavalin A-like lectin/glucanases superfamily
VTYQATVLADNPVGFWPMTEAAAPLANLGSEGTALTTAQGAPTFQDVALLSADVGKNPKLLTTAALIGPGANAYSPQLPANANALTAEAWIKPTAAAIADPYNLLVTKFKADGSVTEYQLFLLGGKLQFDILNSGLGGSWSIQGATVLTADTVYHVVGVYSHAAPAISVFDNAVQDGTSSTALSGTALASSTAAPVEIGGRADLGGTGTFQGDIGWVALYPSALSAARILAHYDAGIAAIAAGTAPAALLATL